MLSFNYEGRRYEGSQLSGRAALALCREAMPIIHDSGILTGAEPRQAMAAMMADPRTFDLIGRTLEGWAVDDIPCAGPNFDRAFAGRPLDAVGATIMAWKHLGFFGSGGGSAAVAQSQGAGAI